MNNIVTVAAIAAVPVAPEGFHSVTDEKGALWLKADTDEADLIAAGQKFESLLGKYLDAKFRWGPLARNAAVKTHEKFSDGQTWSEVGREHPKWAFKRKMLRENGGHQAQIELSALFELMEPLADEIIDAQSETIEGLRAKTLVATWNALPGFAFHDGSWSFEDMGYFALWEASIYVTGLSHLMTQISERLMADSADDPEGHRKENYAA